VKHETLLVIIVTLSTVTTATSAYLRQRILNQSMNVRIMCREIIVHADSASVVICDNDHRIEHLQGSTVFACKCIENK